MCHSDKPKSEHLEQAELVRDFRRAFPGVLIFAIPNGGWRTKTTALKLRVEGCVAGIPDLFIPAWNLWIEMKRAKGGTVSKEQKEQMAYLQSVGHSTIVGRGRDDAWLKIQEFIKNRPPIAAGKLTPEQTA